MIVTGQTHRGESPPSADAPSVIVMGCGRSHRRDDQIGLLIADLLQAHPPPCTTVLRSEDPGADLLTQAVGAHLVVIVDANRARAGSPPGSCSRFVISRKGGMGLDDLFKSQGDRPMSSSHLLSVSDALALSRELGLLAPELWIYAVSAESFGYGDELSRDLRRSIQDVARRIQTDVRAWLRNRSKRHA
jgi:hydrogenase maturation protease